METVVKKLEACASATPSRWREEAEYRRENKAWLRHSQAIAARMLDRMERIGLTQRMLSERMGCSQQYVSRILRGKENLSLETLCKIEEALHIQLVCEAEAV